MPGAKRNELALSGRRDVIEVLARAAVPKGFGVLIPRQAGYRALGVTCDGYLFPRGNRERLMVRVLLGGTFDADIRSLDPDDVALAAEEEVARLFGLTVAPLFKRARLWPNAIPQYELGHTGRRAELERHLASARGLYLAGNALYGTSFGKAAARGVACGRRAVEWIDGRRMG